MPLCCGHERDSRYCPDCGADLGDRCPALSELLKHIRKNQRNHETTIARHEKLIPGEPDEGIQAYHRERIEVSRRLMAQWQRWGDALAAVVRSGWDEGQPRPPVG